MTTCACGNCQFFDNQSEAATQHEAIGLCRYNPPYPQANAQERGLWPVVERSDWCGHFAATIERFMTPAHSDVLRQGMPGGH